MITFLPLELVRDEDALEIGLELRTLAKLRHLGFPVADGIVVLPPSEEIGRLIRKFKSQRSGLNEELSTFFTQEFDQIEPDEELRQELQQKFSDYRVVWQDLLKKWLDEAKSKILRSDFKENKLSLRPLEVFFSRGHQALGIAYFDKARDRVIIETEMGDLSANQLESLDELIRKMEKKLILPFKFVWILDQEQIKFVKLIHLTNSEISEKTASGAFKMSYPLSSKNHLKVFYTQNSGFILDKGADGLIIETDSRQKFDEKALKLVEAATSYGNKEVIYKLADFKAESQNSFVDDAKAVLFARNKKGLLNVSLVISGVENVDQFQQIKRDLASLGIARKGSLKIWLEIQNPENLVNIEDYIDVGFDGVIVDVDVLGRKLAGQVEDLDQFEKTVTRFLEQPAKILSRANIAVVVKAGKFNNHLLEFMVQKGIYGVILEPDRGIKINQFESAHLA